MTKEQAGGYLFEAAIWELLKRSGYVQVKAENLEGRGGSHQIDAVGYWKIPVPFVYPVRLMIEGKFREDTGLSEIRSFLGAFIDIKENYFVRGKIRPVRYTDVACVCSKGSFTQPAQDYAWAHNIFLISFKNVRSLSEVLSRIEVFLETASLNKEKAQLVKDFLATDLSIGKNTSIQDQVLIMGMLDGKYPVMLSTTKSFVNFLQGRSLEFGDVLRAIKTERITGEFETVYRIGSVEDVQLPLEFSIPNSIAQKLSGRIDTISKGGKVFEIEIASAPQENKRTPRRIFRLDVILG